MMTDEEAAEQARESMRISKTIYPLLAGNSMEVQGAVLLDLVSLYFAGHHPAWRDRAIAQWMDTMRDMIAASEEQLGNPWSTKQ